MKRYLATYSLWMLVVLYSFPPGLKSQPASIRSMQEHVEVCTDRSMYITGENILLSAIIYNDNVTGADNYSRVLYCELITPSGNRITGGKYAVNNSTTEACLAIPADAITGNYFLKSYTRYMRNGDPENYHFIMLKIINADKPDVLSGYNEMEMNSEQGMKEGNGEQWVSLGLAKNTYQPWEGVALNIAGIPGMDGRQKFCLAVIPAGPWDSISYRRDSISYRRDSISDTLRYYPETRGISLSGRFLENQTGQAIANAKINLSIIGDRDVMAVRTNSSGEFYFALPGYAGGRDIFLCGEDIPEISSSLFIDNDFCSRPLNLSAPAFHLTEAERETAYQFAVNQKLTTVFHREPNTREAVFTGHQIPFYGQPDETLVMDKFIDLPTLEEYFHELLGQVNIRKQDGKKHFRFLTTRTEMTIYDPLVLIDWVAVDDIDRILAMSPRAIDRIELVNALYIKGSITYGGIISFVSKKNDFAGIDLPASGTFVNYTFFGDCHYNTYQEPLPRNIPDTRNTFYWNPEVLLNDDGGLTESFKAPGTPGKYLIVLRRMDNTGTTIISTHEIEVVAE